MAQPCKGVFNLPEVSLAPERGGGTVQGSQDKGEGMEKQKMTIGRQLLNVNLQEDEEEGGWAKNAKNKGK